MDSYLTPKSHENKYPIYLLFILVTFANYYIYIGFAIKSYMIFLILYLIIHINSLYFQRLHLFEMALLLFYLMYSFTGLFALYPVASIRIMLGIFLYISFYFMMKWVISNYDHFVIEKAVANAGIFFNVASLILYLIGLKSLGFVFDGDRITQFGVMLDRNYPRLIGLVQDPNFFVFYNTLFFSYFLCNTSSAKNKIGLVLCIITSLLSFSRGGILVMICIFLIFLLIKNPIKQLKLLFGTSTILVTVLYVTTVHFKFNIFGILKSRIFDLFQDGGSGRLELWGRAWDFFTNNMLFGIGAFNFAEYNSFYYGDNLEVHNTFLDILSESGLIGMSCYLLFIIFMFVQLFQSNLYKHTPYLFLTFLGYIFQMGFLSIIINDMFFLYMAILSSYLYNKENKMKKQVPIPILNSMRAKDLYSD